MKICKKTFSSVVACVLCGALFLTPMSGCGNKTDEPTSGANATYTATSKGYGGDVTVTVVVDGGKITSVGAEGLNETQSVGGQAITQFNDGKLGNLVGQEAASCEFLIDATSGATMTSTALKNCLNEIKGQITGVKSAEKTPMTAGTYVKTVYGNNYSRPFEVTVVLSEGSIDSIEVTNIGGETADILQTAIDMLIPRIEESQSIAVDSVTGATASSSGIKTAVASAIDEAGGDSSQWYTEVANKTDTVVLDGYDVIVVGLGGAGMPAFCSAAESGATVIGIEAAGKIGGTSTNVGGPMTINPVSAEVQPASGTAGYPVDTKALKSQWLSDTKGEAKESCIDLMLEDSGGALDWLIDNYDFTFGPLQNFMGYNFIVYSSYRPAAGQTVTDIYVHAIEKACEQNEKDQYVLELKANKILTDKDGEVCGVSAEYYDGTIYEIYAPSVVLCTGGFGGSSEMTEQYIGSAMSLYGMYQNDGTMLKAAISDLGAATFNIATPGISHAARTTTDLRSSDIIPSHQKALDAIVVSTNVLHVDETGNRFCQGDTTTDITENAYKAGNFYYSIVTQDYMDKVKADGLDQVYMMINGQDESLPLSALMGGNVEIDPETAKYALMVGDPITDLDDIIALGVELGIVYEADSLEALADMIGADNLVGTVTAYNGYCASGTDPELGKSADNLVALDPNSTKFYAIKGTSYCYSTCGGLDVNENIEVLDADGNVITGLYACGTDSMGVLLNVEEGYFDYGGIAHGWCFTSGKIAGQNAAEYALSKKD